MRIEFEGKIHEFPDDFTDADIAVALGTKAPEKTDTQKRAEIGGGRLQIANPLSFLGIGKDRYDLGINTSQNVDEFIAGAGRRFRDIGTLGLASRNEEGDKLLDGSGYATAGGLTADLATLATGGAAFKAAGKGTQLAKVGQNFISPTSVRNAALVGGGYNAATTQGDLTDRAISGGFGAVGGALGQGVASGLGKVLRPKLDYDGPLSGLTLRPGDKVNDAIVQARQLAAEAGKEKQFDTILQNRLYPRLNESGVIDGQTFKKIDTALGEAAQKLLRNIDSTNRDLGHAVKNVQIALRESLEGSDADKKALEAANKRYAKLKGIENALGAGGNKLPAMLTGGGLVASGLNYSGVPSEWATLAGVLAAGGQGSKAGQRAIAKIVKDRPEWMMRAGGRVESAAPVGGLLGGVGAPLMIPYVY